MIVPSPDSRAVPLDEIIFMCRGRYTSSRTSLDMQNHFFVDKNNQAVDYSKRVMEERGTVFAGGGYKLVKIGDDGAPSNDQKISVGDKVKVEVLDGREIPELRTIREVTPVTAAIFEHIYLYAKRDVTHLF
ncbi:MAG TPA: hypothetical protein VJI97_04565 [Candidatus Nanoarchaeia archaeon]|nr:hypothetical protein [Candidatus Nanoarchaeia archaeon]